MALMYTYGFLIVVSVVGIIWARHELKKTEQTDKK